MRPQSWHITYNGCRRSASGVSSTRNRAFDAVAKWESDHRLSVPGCRAQPTTYTIGPVKE